MTRNGATLLLAAAALAPPRLAAGQTSVVDTRHNLSVSGPGEIRAVSEQEVCIFCHTPHGASAVQPLWNRDVPVMPYTIYESSALDAEPGQPTGASKMCLSCHDGTIALGSVFSRDQAIQMAAGITTLPPGTSNLGTDLSDDHPISFRFDTLLATRDARLRNPHTLPPALRLDANDELQCTTCHDAHNDSFGDFLVTSNTASALCRSCHQISSTTIDAHEDCSACHRPHSAPSGPFLLKQASVSATCLECHDGSAPRAANILASLGRVSVHEREAPVNVPGPELVRTTCTDCHEPHTMATGESLAPDAAPCLGQVAGVSSSGAAVTAARFEYEVCFRCHADDNVALGTSIQRQITQINTRLEFAPSAASSHPVVAVGSNPDVPSLIPPWTESSLVRCSDCHGSDTGRMATGGGPGGVHGSSHSPLLVARYDTLDFSPESSGAYALCYRCHYREGFNGILNDRSFPHRLHVVDQRAPCSVCHDAHGIASGQGSRVRNAHLINFDTSVVFAAPNGQLQYDSTGPFSGSCTLTCHGFVHSALGY